MCDRCLCCCLWQTSEKFLPVCLSAWTSFSASQSCSACFAWASWRSLFSRLSSFSFWLISATMSYGVRENSGWRAIFIHDSVFFFSLLFSFFSSFSFFWNLFVLVFNKLATRSKADSSSVYPIGRKFAWRAANSFFKFPSNFLHSLKIFPFIYREKFLTSPFTNGATICISKGWTRGSTSSEKSSWSKSFAIALLANIRLIESLTNVNASQQCRSVFKLRAFNQRV